MEMRKIAVRKIKDSDWELLKDWWADYPVWNGKGFDKEMLPGLWKSKPPIDITEDEEKTLSQGGFIVTKGEKPVAACWLYVTNSKMAFIAPVVADKFYRDTDREEAIKLLIHYTTQFAYDLGFEYCYAWSNQNNLTNYYEEAGYKSAPCTELVAKL